MTPTIIIIILIGAFLRYLIWRRERSGNEQVDQLIPSPAPAAREGLYCPECGVQYQPGISRCVDCDVALVKEKPEEEEERDDTDLVEVYLSLDMNEVMYIKSLLQEADIPFSVQGEGLNDPFAPSQVADMLVLVPEKYEEAARELLTEISTQNTDQQEEV